METGKLHQIKEHFWLLYPSKEDAYNVDVSYATDPGDALYFRERFGVDLVGKGYVFTVLEHDEDKDCYKILTTHGQLGWLLVEEEECEDDLEELQTPDIQPNNIS